MWEILINISEGHYKFWSYEVVNSFITGKVIWGRIGTVGSGGIYSSSVVEERKREKLNSGYFSYGMFDSAILRQESITDIDRLRNNIDSQRLNLQHLNLQHNLIPPQREDKPLIPPITQPTPERTPVRRGRRSRAELLGRNMETNREGYIVNIPNYQRVNFEDFLNTVKIFRQSELSPALREIAEQYYNHLSPDLFHTKHRWDNLSASDLPTFIFVFSNKEILSVIQIKKRAGLIEFWALKVNANNRIKIIKYLLKVIARLSETEKITFNIKNKTILNDIKGFNLPSEKRGKTVIFNKLDLQNIVLQVNQKPLRWIE